MPAPLQGKTTVVFETLKYDGKTVAAHKDIKDKDQTVRFPELRTSAANTATGVIEGYRNVQESDSGPDVHGERRADG